MTGVHGSLVQRFEAKLPDDRQSEQCWEWQASRSKEGYGRINGGPEHGGRIVLAHRVSYELHVGPIPDGLQLDHLCRNRACVNPEHLEPVTPRENVLRGEAPTVRAWRTNTCKRGHSLTDRGYVRPDGKRHCLECRAIRRQERAA